MGGIDDIERAVREILSDEPPRLDAEFLAEFVDLFLVRREAFLAVCRAHGSPLYLLETGVLQRRAAEFTRAFRRVAPEVRVFYAMKSNHHPVVARTLVQAGLGLDASSGLELEAALAAGSREIVFSGPGKTEPELELASRHRDRVTVLMDSFGELERLEAVAARLGAGLRAGVRLSTEDSGLWGKFGIPLRELPRFLSAAEAGGRVAVAGLQFHTSWNLDPGRQIAFIERLGAALDDLDPGLPARLEFIDIGGGFWPEAGEWVLPAGTPAGQLRRSLGMHEEPGVRYRLPALPIEEFAERLGTAVRTHLLPRAPVKICAEPGRWICHDAMHILLTVVDRKADDLVITDAGTNAVGWERFESDYFPVINLSRPELVERECRVLGSLCTPHDVWGYRYFGSDIRPGDVLLVPTQGAYTYSLRQDFIKPLPEVVVM